MTNHYEPFLDPEVDYQQKSAMEAEVAAAGHPHLLQMFQDRQRLLRDHALYHVLGHADSPEHQACLERIDQIGEDGLRGFKAIWS